MTTLTPDHIAILQALKDHKGTPPSLSDLWQLSGINKAKYWHYQVDLRDAGYMHAERAPGARSNSAMFVTLQMAGRRALGAHHRSVAQAAQAQIKTPPGRTNLFDLPVYQPPHQGYYRNNGNTHIPSRGFAC